MLQLQTSVSAGCLRASADSASVYEKADGHERLPNVADTKSADEVPVEMVQLENTDATQTRNNNEIGEVQEDNKPFPESIEIRTKNKDMCSRLVSSCIILPWFLSQY